MKEINPRALKRPIRVVLFGGGPALESGVKRFLARLEQQPEIALVGAFCQSASQSLPAIIRDVFKRRRLLAVPILLTQGLELAGQVVTAPRQHLALRRGLQPVRDRLHFVPDIHHQDVLTAVRALEPDLGLVYGSPILKPSLFRLPRFGTLGIHHGKLPTYRGKKTTFWAMVHGEPTAGVTIQLIDEGLDTGRIVKQGEVTIGRRSPRAVWSEVESLGLDLYIRAILAVRAATVTPQSSSTKRGRLFRDPTPREIAGFYWHRWLGKRSS